MGSKHENEVCLKVFSYLCSGEREGISVALLVGSFVWDGSGMTLKPYPPETGLQFSRLVPLASVPRSEQDKVPMHSPPVSTKARG